MKTSSAQQGGAAALRWRAPPDPLRVLRSCAWLGEHEQPLAVDAARSSHLLHRVRRGDGACAIVKQVPPQTAAQGRHLGRELFVYRLAGWIPAVARALPACLHLDERCQLLATESLCKDADWPAAARADLLQADFAAALGRLLAGFHRATVGLPMPATPALGVLGLNRSLALATQGRSAATQALMRQAVAAPAWSALLDEGARLHRLRCVIHGDLKTENWLRRGRRGACLIDWELAGGGDPAWDLGCLVAEAALNKLRAAWPAPVAAAELADQLLRPQPALAALAKAYRHAAGTGAACPIDLAQADNQSRVALFACARLLHVACEWADCEAEANSPGPSTAASVWQLAEALRQRQADLRRLLASAWTVGGA